MHGCGISMKLPLVGFGWVEEASHFSEVSKKTTVKIMMKDIFLQLMLNMKYNLHNDSQSLPKRTKIRKVEKLSGSLYDIKDYVIHIRELKQALNYGLVFKSA